ncbi:MAG: hypothetical protein ACYDEX_26395 [Mobilitalea sp.]
MSRKCMKKRKDLEFLLRLKREEFLIKNYNLRNGGFLENNNHSKNVDKRRISLTNTKYI